MALRRACWVAALLATGCQTCVDLSQPAPFQCTYGGDPTQCPGGWRCGKVGQCFDPDAGAPLACNTTADCPSDWRCGEAQVCFDPADGGPLQCLVDAGANDCANGWRCGLEGICHQVDAGAPYECVNDSNCEAGWRCDLSAQTCANVPQELIPPASGPTSLAAVRSNPILRGAPLMIAAADTEAVNTGIIETWPGAIVAVVDGGFLWTSLGQQNRFDSPGLEAASAVPWPRDIRALTTVPQLGGAFVYVLDGTGFWELDSPGSDAGLLWASNGEDRLRRLQRSYTVGFSHRVQNLLLAFSSREFSFVDDAHSFAYLAQPLPASDGGAQVIHDMAFAEWAKPDAGPWLFAAGDEGLFATPAAPSGPIVWSPIGGDAFGDLASWSNAACAAQTAPAILRLESFNGTSYVGDVGSGNWIAAQFDDSTTFQPNNVQWFYQWGEGTVGALGMPSCNGTTPVPLGEYGEEVLQYPQRDVCPAGFDVDHLDGPSAVSVGDSGLLFVVACRADGGALSPLRVRYDPPPPSLGQQLDWVDAQGASTFFSDLAVEQSDFGGFMVAAGAHGQVWLDPQTGVNPLPLFLDTSPNSLGALPDGGTLITGNEQLFSQTSFGLEPVAIGGSAVETLVDGRPDLVLTVNGTSPIFASGQVVTPDPITGTYTVTVATLDGTLTPLVEPFHAAAVALDGGNEVVVTSINSVYAEQLLAGSVVPLTLRASLPFGLPITSMTFPPATSGALVDGYLLSNEGVFRLTAASEETWTVTQVQVPIGTWIKVWSDTARPRIGYADGTVLGLPEPVLLAGPVAFSGGCAAESVQDYADLCGQTFALSQCNLYRLVPDGAGSGTWAAESAAWSAGFDDRDLTGGAILSSATTLYVVSRFGEAVVLTPAGACP